jgi:hypothetical protein
MTSAGLPGPAVILGVFIRPEACLASAVASSRAAPSLFEASSAEADLAVPERPVAAVVVRIMGQALSGTAVPADDEWAW